MSVERVLEFNIGPSISRKFSPEKLLDIEKQLAARYGAQNVTRRDKPSGSTEFVMQVAEAPCGVPAPDFARGQW